MDQGDGLLVRADQQVRLPRRDRLPECPRHGARGTRQWKREVSSQKPRRYQRITRTTQCGDRQAAGCKRGRQACRTPSVVLKREEQQAHQMFISLIRGLGCRSGCSTRGAHRT